MSMGRLGRSVVAVWLLAVGIGGAQVARAEVRGVESFTKEYFWEVPRALTYGWAFTVDSAITVTHLGFWDDYFALPGFQGDAGLSRSHEVFIWNNASHALIASGTVPAGTAGALDNEFRYVSIAPTTLSSGVTYVIGAYYYESGDSDVIAYGSYYCPMGSGVTWAGGRYGEGNAFPGGEVYNQYNLGPNWKHDPAPVPEPTAVQLPLLIGLGSAALWRRRRTRG